MPKRVVTTDFYCKLIFHLLEIWLASGLKKRLAMKPILSLILTIFLTVNGIAQDCTLYFPMSEGAQFEIINYNGKGKQKSRSVTEIITKEQNGQDIIVKAIMHQYSNNDQDTVSIEYTAGCINGVFQINMFTGMNKSQSGLFELDGDLLDIPASPTAGQKLEDKLIIIKVAPNEETGEALINFKYNFVNRKVEAIETITTPAGSFKSVKLVYDINTRFIFPITMHVIEWYSEGVGQVRSEIYNKKGKLQSYSVLTKFSN